MTPELWIFAAVMGAVLLGAVLYLRRILGADGQRTPRGAVAAAPEAVPPRLKDLVERQGLLEADYSTLARRLGDLEKAWERRWGTLARGMRRDAAAEAAEALAAPVQDSGDAAQVEFPMNAPPPQPTERRQLRPMRMKLGNG